MVTQCLEKVQTYISNNRQYYKKNLKVLIGAKASISSKSLTSLELTLWAPSLFRYSPNCALKFLYEFRRNALKNQFKKPKNPSK